MSSAEVKIIIRTMTLKDYKKMEKFLRENFYNGEPLCASALHEFKLDVAKENDEYLSSMIRQDTCLLAVEDNSEERIVGLILAAPQYPSDLQKHRIEDNETQQSIGRRIARFLSKVEFEADLFERYKVPKLLYLHIINVATSMRGKGIGTRLISALMELGRNREFSLLAAYCTSFYAARQMELLGMECCYSLAYEDYKDGNGVVVFKPAPPHTQLRVMSKKL